MPRRKQSQHSITGSTTVPKELQEDYEAYEGLRTSPEGLKWLIDKLDLWIEVGTKMKLQLGDLPNATVSDLPDNELIGLVWGKYSSVNEAVKAFYGPAKPWTDFKVIFSAYLGRMARRGTRPREELGMEMALVLLWLDALDDFLRRTDPHPMGSLLSLIAFAPDNFGEDFAATMFIRKAERSRPTWWVQGVLGEVDGVVARQERRSLVGRRVAEEAHRLRRQPVDQVWTNVMAGRLNYFRRLSRQAVLRDQRPQRERHTELQEPEQITDPSVQYEAERRAEDPERIATAVINAFRLSPAQQKVVRHIVSRPERLTLPEIARGAGVSLWNWVRR